MMPRDIAPLSSHKVLFTRLLKIYDQPDAKLMQVALAGAYRNYVIRQLNSMVWLVRSLGFDFLFTTKKVDYWEITSNRLEKFYQLRLVQTKDNNVIQALSNTCVFAITNPLRHTSNARDNRVDSFCCLVVIDVHCTYSYTSGVCRTITLFTCTAKTQKT